MHLVVEEVSVTPATATTRATVELETADGDKVVLYLPARAEIHLRAEASKLRDAYEYTVSTR